MNRRRGLISRAWHHLAEAGLEGVVHTVRWKLTRRLVSLEDRVFDALHGTETRTWVELDQLSISSANKARGVRYEPTRHRAFLRIARSLSLPLDGGFVDLGCGKGKVLLLAMEHGFQRIVGVEFSREMCEIARRNVDGYRRSSRRDGEVVLVEGDAAEYLPSVADRVFYLYNPFDRVVLSKVVENIVASCAQHPRRVWIIYGNPLHRDAIESTPFFTAIAGFTHSGRSAALASPGRYVVYCNEAVTTWVAAPERSALALAAPGAPSGRPGTQVQTTD
jgi:SAM-dependent methyltransferase